MNLNLRKFKCVSEYKRGMAARALPLLFQTAILFVILFGCATTAQIIIEPSSPVKPGWPDKPPPPEGGTLYFIGTSTSSDTLEQGKKAALENAMAEISNYMGTRIESVFQSHLTEIDRNVSFQMKSECAAFVKSAKVVDLYYVKLIRIDKNFRMEKFDVFILVSLSAKEAKEEVARQQKEKLEKANSAHKYYLTGLSDEKKTKFYNARSAYKKAIDLLAQMNEVVVIKDNDIKNSDELNFCLKNRIQHINSQLSKVSLSIKLKGSGNAENAFISNFMLSLGKHGFTITSEEPAYKISGDVFVLESSYVMNNYVYYAEGTVSAERTSDHQIVATYSFNAKGFHRQKQQSELNALAEGGIEAGNALAEMMRKKEKAGL